MFLRWQKHDCTSFVVCCSKIKLVLNHTPRLFAIVLMFFERGTSRWQDLFSHMLGPNDNDLCLIWIVCHPIFRSLRQSIKELRDPGSVGFTGRYNCVSSAYEKKHHAFHLSWMNMRILLNCKAANCALISSGIPEDLYFSVYNNIYSG